MMASRAWLSCVAVALVCEGFSPSRFVGSPRVGRGRVDDVRLSSATADRVVTDAPAVAAATNAEWRAACDSTGVVSWHDFGVSLTPVPAFKPILVTPEPTPAPDVEPWAQKAEARRAELAAMAKAKAEAAAAADAARVAAIPTTTGEILAARKDAGLGATVGRLARRGARKLNPFARD